MENISLETIVTVIAAVVLFLRIHTGIDSIRKELKSDIQRVEKKSEDAHKEINEKLGAVQTAQAAQAERFNTIAERFNTVDERFNTVDERFNTADERFNRVDDGLARLDQKIDDIAKRVDR